MARPAVASEPFIAESVMRRLVPVMRLFPALTPEAIRRLRVYEWWVIAMAADEWVAERQRQAAKLRG